MSARAWWPEGAPHPQRKPGEHTSRELSALIEWTAARLGNPQVAELHAVLCAERTERAGCLAALTERARSGGLVTT